MTRLSLDILRERAREKMEADRIDREALALIASCRPIRPAEIHRDVLQALLEKVHLGSEVRSLAASSSFRREVPPLTIAADGSLATSITTVVALTAPARPKPRPKPRTAKKPKAASEAGDVLAFQTIAALAVRAGRSAESAVPKSSTAAKKRKSKRPSVPTLSRALHRNGRDAIAIHEGPLASELAAIYRLEARAVAARFEDRASLVIASGDRWNVHPDEVLSVPEFARQLRTKSDPVRRAVLEALVAIDGIDFDLSHPMLASALERSAEHVTHAGESVRDAVRRVMLVSLEEGLSIAETASAIRQEVEAVADARARTIARTELSGLVNGGTVAAATIFAQESGVTLYKRWLVAPLAENPRHEDYEGLDGQTVPLGGLFDVGGAKLEFPGDPSGPIDQVANCRCVIVVTEEAPAAVVAAGQQEAATGITSALDRIGESLVGLLGREQPAPRVNVSVPEQPAPVVNVQNDVQVDVPRPRPVRVKKQRDGSVIYEPQEDE